MIGDKNNYVNSDPEQAMEMGDEFSVSSEEEETSNNDPSSSETLAKGETRVVRLLRGVVLTVLLLTAAGVSFAVYRYTSNQEQQEFQNSFDDSAKKVIESLKVNTAGQLTAVDNFADAISVTAKENNETWPMVTVPNYSLLARSALSSTKALSILIHPVVNQEERAEWNKYALEHNAEWKEQDLALQAQGFYNKKLSQKHNTTRRNLQETDISEYDVVGIENGMATDIYDTVWVPGEENPLMVRSPAEREIFYPVWQNVPAIPWFPENGESPWASFYPTIRLEHKALTGASYNTEGGIGAGLSVTDGHLITWGREDEAIGSDPLGCIFYPVHEDFDNDATKVVAIVAMFIHWRQLFVDILPPDAIGVYAVFENNCDQRFTFVINGKDVVYLDEHDLHDPSYDEYMHFVDMVDSFNADISPLYYGVPLSKESGCSYTLSVYPSKEFEDQFVTSTPMIYTGAVILIFLFAAAIFLLYDCAVELRQRLVMRNALRSGAIVSSMFPKEIQERMMQEQEDGNKTKRNKNAYMSSTKRVKSFLNGEGGDDEDCIVDSKPIADLFPETTVMFSDIENFTAWSSQRDPAQVFTLLQSIYQAFDKIAQRMKVFKVETVGDSYVAVAGLPVPQPNHSVIMVKFAQACLFRFAKITKQLEVTLGPDTGDLRIRFGLHSGPCTAGVLRGDRSRFQLFGDTINTAARMENSGIPNRIQISKATAENLKEAGKQDWFQPRPDEVRLKGKGIVSTFLITKVRGAGSIASEVPSLTETTTNQHCGRGHEPVSRKKTARLVSWNVETLASRLREVVARRMVVKGRKAAASSNRQLVFKNEDRGDQTCLDEIDKVILMPAFDPKIAAKEVDPNSIDLGFKVMSQLRSFVEVIANLYRENPFHNFEHASHVTMSVDKLLKRIVAPDIDVETKDTKQQKGLHDIMEAHHDYTHGITSDPITQFGIIVSALIHDADHRGVSNAQLTKENPSLAKTYRNKSVAEQNSIDLAWELLMLPEYEDLRNCIYDGEEELRRFRQTVLNVVLATDIFDKELNDLRKQRWNLAFAEGSKELTQEKVNVKATIVIEHLIQASDVSHTMQHWHIYRKWNECLFREMSQAFQAGRMGADPATFWYKGEIGFFDNYVIPLAKKLKDCNVFGVSSDEYLSYAKANRDEWEQKGQQIVAELVEKYKFTTLEEGDNEEEEEDDEMLMEVMPVTNKAII